MFSKTNWTQSNIAAIDGKDSQSGLFRQSQGHLTPVVHVRDPRSWQRPEYGYDEDTGVVVQREDATVVIQQDPHEQFEQDIIRSELLSRGWTYQEILLSPANLLCTQQMMWWSCSDATCSELFPENIPNLGNDISKPLLFVDELRSRKVALKPGKDPIDIWMDIISSYSRTSVTFRDDRIVAIAGIARLFSSWFPDILNSAESFGHFHSGIWSTKVIQQILWSCDSPRLARRSQYYQSRIPSWSPLSSLRCSSTCRYGDKAITLAEYVEIGSSGTTGVFGTDQFGRVQEENEAVLHLRSVLVSIIVIGEFTGLDLEDKDPFPFDGEYGHENDLYSDLEDDEGGEDEEDEEIIRLSSSARLQDYSGQYFDIVWDTVEDRARARALPPSYVNGVDLRALPCEIHQSHIFPDKVRIVGIVLRPDYEAFHRTVKNDEIQRNLWVRCGFFKFCVTPQSANGFERAFAFERYGWTFETGVSDNRGEHEQAYLHPARTGTAPDLDDVFIL